MFCVELGEFRMRPVLSEDYECLCRCYSVCELFFMQPNPFLQAILAALVCTTQQMSSRDSGGMSRGW